MRLKIRRLDSTIPLPTYATDESAGFDLAAAHDLLRPARRGRRWCARASSSRSRPATSWEFSPEAARRSSAVSSWPNGVGIIDPDYCGADDEVMIQVLNITDSKIRIRRGDRLAQGIVLPGPPRHVGRKSRRPCKPTRGGFGSTDS
jgi:dUTP pyrophosphatase